MSKQSAKYLYSIGLALLQKGPQAANCTVPAFGFYVIAGHRSTDPTNGRRVSDPRRSIFFGATPLSALCNWMPMDVLTVVDAPEPI